MLQGPVWATPVLDVFHLSTWSWLLGAEARGRQSGLKPRLVLLLTHFQRVELLRSFEVPLCQGRVFCRAAEAVDGLHGQLQLADAAAGGLGEVRQILGAHRDEISGDLHSPGISLQCLSGPVGMVQCIVHWVHMAIARLGMLLQPLAMHLAAESILRRRKWLIHGVLDLRGQLGVGTLRHVHALCHPRFQRRRLQVARIRMKGFPRRFPDLKPRFADVISRLLLNVALVQGRVPGRSPAVLGFRDPWTFHGAQVCLLCHFRGMLGLEET
mmetsp:Transcript_42886/g.79994  ORF Transcript_42886/g.79994 Transcript_42886/m.79994 type:complete len:269 (+) Transcript_42886:339-1145(+)